MEFDNTPVNFAGMLGLSPQTDPRILAQNQQQIDQQGQQVQLQRQQAQAQAMAAQQKAQQQQAYQQSVQAYLAKPTVEGATALQMQFPDQADAIKGAFQQREKTAQDSDFREMTRLYGLIGSGRTEDAKKVLQGRIDAGKAAGQDVSDDQQLLDQVNTDPTKAQAFLGYVMSSVGGADKFAAIHEQLRLAGGKGADPFTLGAGEIRYDGQGNILAASPYKPTLERGPNGELIEYTPGGATAPLDKATVFSRMIHAESAGQQFTAGRPTTSAKGALGIAQIMPATGPEAARLAGVPWSPERLKNDGEYNRQLGEAYFGKLLTDFNGDTRKAVAAYNAGAGRVKAAVAKGGADWESRLPAETKGYLASVLAGGGQGGGSNIRVLTPPKAPEPKTVIMTPTEVSAIPGLDPNTVYQRKPDGSIAAVGGQSRSQLKPWPAAALASRTTNNAALANIRGAIHLLDPKNNSPEAHHARDAIGFGTGALGDRFTQWHDPQGTSARARIGQIGGLIIKDVSGAAVSLSEDQRLAKWVPLVTDSPAVAREKLRNLERELGQKNQAMDETYSEDQGFRPFTQARPQAAANGFRILRVRPK